MNKTMLLLMMLGLTFFVSQSAWAGETVEGKVSYLGTLQEYTAPNEGYHAQFRMRVSQSICGNDKTPKDRWILVKSGRMEGAFAHNSVNTHNAFSAVLAAFLAGKNIQIDNVPNCNSATAQNINLWSSPIGIY